MGPYTRVLLGTDGSPDAEAAVAIGGRIAAAFGIPAVVIVVHEKDDKKQWAEEIAAEAVGLLQSSRVGDVETKVRGGNPPDVILDAASEDADALVVIGSAGLGRTGSRLSGSTSNKLSHHSPADVLFARDPAPKIWNFVAMATDGTETSHRAVRRGLAIADALDARPRLITAAKNREDGDRVLAETAAELDLESWPVEVEREVLVDSQPASALALAGWKYELMVIGNKSMSGPSRLLGSVANKVTHGSETNLLLVNTTRT